MKQWRAAFSFQAELLHQVRRQGPRSVKALLPQTGRTIPKLSAPPAPQAVSILLPCISLLPLQKARGHREINSERVAYVLAILNPTQTCKKLDILVSFSTSSWRTSHTTNTYIATTIKYRISRAPHIWRKGNRSILSPNSCHQSTVGKQAKLRSPYMQAYTKTSLTRQTKLRTVSNGKSEEGWGSKTLLTLIQQSVSPKACFMAPS